MKYIYVAGPIAKPDPGENINKALKVADELFLHGFAPFIPHLSYLWHIASPKHYEGWMSLDFAWIERCDGLLRIPGESPGADREVKFARDRGIPIFEAVEHPISGAIEIPILEMQEYSCFCEGKADAN